MRRVLESCFRQWLPGRCRSFVEEHIMPFVSEWEASAREIWKILFCIFRR